MRLMLFDWRINMVESNLGELRQFLGTSPEELTGMTETQAVDYVEGTKFYRGVEEIEVQLVPGSYASNPYRALYTMATATWGDVWATDRWEKVSPEARFEAVKAVLGRKTLPNAMEVPSFMFEIAGPSRSSFDQVARARIGAVFGSMGWRDNSHAAIGFRVPEAIYDDLDSFAAFKAVTRFAKRGYIDYLRRGQGNWQDARAMLPISACHRYTFGINYMALQNFMAKRLMFSEQADTVATAWLMRLAVMTEFPLLGRYLRPASDHARRCVEHVGDEFAQAFGNLFRCSGRWPCDVADDRYTFNVACTSRESLMEQLQIVIPRGDQNLPGTETWDSLAISDRLLLGERRESSF